MSGKESEAAVEIEVETEDWLAVLPQVEAEARTAAEAALVAAGRGGGVVILLTDDAAVAELNRQFRGKTGPTNVLSFPAAANPVDHLGDVALAFGVCQAEAEAQGKRLADHLQHLVAHGVLHLVGFDHQTDQEAQAMEGLERRILQGLGVPDPYGAEEDPADVG